MNVDVIADRDWWMVIVNGVEVDAFQSRQDAQIFARYYKNKMSTANSVDYNRGFNQ